MNIWNKCAKQFKWTKSLFKQKKPLVSPLLILKTFEFFQIHYQNLIGSGVQKVTTKILQGGILPQKNIVILTFKLAFWCSRKEK